MTEDVVEDMVECATSAFSEKLISSASTRQYESDVLAARQLGQSVLPTPFSEKQQRQSRFDGEQEIDGRSTRPHLLVHPSEPLAHISREQSAAVQGNHHHAYTELPLTGCQLSVIPFYQLPHTFMTSGRALDTEGAVFGGDAAQLAGLPWEFVSGCLQHFWTASGEPATPADFEEDAKVFEQCFSRDVRYLHSHNHNHNCSATFVKNQKKKTLEDQAKLLNASRAPPCRFFFYRTLLLLMLSEDGAEKCRKVRRRGKELVESAFVIATNERNDFGLVQVERCQPFRSASSDAGQAALRCNLDMRYMLRGFPQGVDVEKLFRCDVSHLAACFRAVSLKALEHAALRRMAMSVVAVHVAAQIVDYYITKYVTRPLEQLQILVTQYALGLQRLEDEEAHAEHDVVPDFKRRAKRITLRLAHAANRCSWISSIEAALFVMCEQCHWCTHNEVPVFASRSYFLMHECQRILQGSARSLIQAAPVPINTIEYECAPSLASDAVGPPRQDPGQANRRDDSHLPAQISHTPTGMLNIGNTCFWNALTQSCRRILLRLPSKPLESVSSCPLAEAFSRDAAPEAVYRRWRCWQYYPPGQQRDASEILIDILNPAHLLHQSCDRESCYAQILRSCTCFTMDITTFCGECNDLNHNSDMISLMPATANTNVSESVCLSLLEQDVKEYVCEACHCTRGRQQVAWSDLSDFLIVHIKKIPGQSGNIVCEPWLRLCGADFQRIAAVHHEGHNPYSGHYTATVSTMAATYHCNDYRVESLEGTNDKAWSNVYIAVYHRVAVSKAHQPHRSGDAYPAARGNVLQQQQCISDEHIVPDIIESDSADRDDAQIINESILADANVPGTSPDDQAGASGDGPHPATNQQLTSCNDGGNDVERNAAEGCKGSDSEDGDTEPSDKDSMEADISLASLRATTSRHDDWLHRGIHLASMPYIVYMMRVERVPKPRKADAVWQDLSPLDAHSSLAKLYRQKVRRQDLAIPRLVGTQCPPEEANAGEDHAAYKLMLFACPRCPGVGACADPLLFRNLLQKDHPELNTYKFAPVWKTHRHRMRLLASRAAMKKNRAEKISVIADTTLMKQYSGTGSDVQPLAAKRPQPPWLCLVMQIMDHWFRSDPTTSADSFMELVVSVVSFKVRSPFYHPEQLHLDEFAALECEGINYNLDMGLLVHKKPFRKNVSQNAANDIDSDDTASDNGQPHRSEALGGCGESDDDVLDDVGAVSDGHSSKNPMKRFDLKGCQDLLRRKTEIDAIDQQSAGRNKESSVQMKAYAEMLAPLLGEALLPVSKAIVSSLLETTGGFAAAQNYQNCVAQELRTCSSGDRTTDTAAFDNLPIDVVVQEISAMLERNRQGEEEECVHVPLPDRVKGPAHVAKALMDKSTKTFNEEQIEVCAMIVYPMELAWRSVAVSATANAATLDNLPQYKLPNDLALPRIAVVGGGGCGKSTVMLDIISPTAETFFQGVARTASSNRAARGFRAKTLHSVSCLRPTDSLRTANLRIQGHAVRKKMDKVQTIAGAWLMDEIFQTPGQLFHAGALRSTYVRKDRYRLNIGD